MGSRPQAYVAQTSGGRTGHRRIERAGGHGQLGSAAGVRRFHLVQLEPEFSKRKKRHIAFGAQLVGVTRTGAQVFAEEMHKHPPARFDNFIFDVGLHRMQDNSCYVYPSVGNFDAHESGTTPGIRESMFDKHWMLGQPVIPGPGW